MKFKNLLGSVVLVSSLLVATPIAFAQTATTTPTNPPASNQCAQGWTWNGSNCQTNQQSCTAAGGNWNNTSASCTFGSQTPPQPSPTPSTTSTNSPQCQSPSYWNNGACVTPAQGCAQSGGTWTNNYCQMSTNASSSYQGGQYQNASSTPYQNPQLPPQCPPGQQCQMNGASSTTSGFNYQNASSTWQQQYNQGNPGQNYRGSNFQQNDQQQQQFEQMAQQQQAKMMSSQIKRMVKEFKRGIKQLTSTQTRLDKRGLPLPQSCADALTQAQAIVDQLQKASSSDDTEASDFESIMQDSQDVQQSLQQCQMEGQQLLSASQMVKMMKRMLSVLSKKHLDVSAVQEEYDTYMVPAYAAIRSGSASDDDIQTFFDTADDIRSQMEDLMSQGDINIPDVFKMFDSGEQDRQPLPPVATSTNNFQATSTTNATGTHTSVSNAFGFSQVASVYEALVKLEAAFRNSFSQR